MDTSVSLESIDSLLQKALDIIGEVNSQSNTTLRTVNLVDGILGQIEVRFLHICVYVCKYKQKLFFSSN